MKDANPGKRVSKFGLKARGAIGCWGWLDMDQDGQWLLADARYWEDGKQGRHLGKWAKGVAKGIPGSGRVGKAA